MSADPNFISDLIIGLLVTIPAIVFHEVAHGYAAYLLGDPTAKMQRRLSLNPVRHVDPFGTILLPIILLAMSGGRFAFGYAKPVPIDPRRFRDYRQGMFLTGIAGPATNLLLAAFAGVMVRLALVLPASPAVGLLFEFMFRFALINLVLMFFNLLPIPPLDGSRVLPLFLSDRALMAYHRFERYGLLIVFLLIWGIPMVFPSIDPVGAYLGVTAYPILSLFTGLNF